MGERRISNERAYEYEDSIVGVYEWRTFAGSQNRVVFTVGDAMKDLLDSRAEIARLERELGEAKHVAATNVEYEKLDTLKRVVEERDELKRAARDSLRRSSSSASGTGTARRATTK